MSRGVVSRTRNCLLHSDKREGVRSRFGSSRGLGLVALVVTATFLHAEGVLAKTVVVIKPGSVNCYPSVTSAPFATIQAAIDSLPVAATATHKVVVCPGTYDEQIRITKNVTVTGVLRDGTDPAEVQGNSAEVKIIPPAGGLVLLQPNDTVAAQVLVQGVADVNLTNLMIEGETGIGCPTSNDVPVRTAGIALQNVGVVNTNLRGTVKQVVVHNMIGMCNDARSFSADGILAENSWFTLDSNSLSNVDLAPIHQIGGIGKIMNNWLNLGFNGILISDVSATTIPGNTGTTVSSNIVTSFSVGVYVDESSHVLVSQNILTNWTGDAIAVVGLGATDNVISANKVIDAWHGIYLNLGAARNMVKNNIIIRAVKAGIVDTFSGGGNVITGNTISQTLFGIWTNLPADDVINPNIFYNTTTLNGSGPQVP